MDRRNFLGLVGLGAVGAAIGASDERNPCITEFYAYETVGLVPFNLSSGDPIEIGHPKGIAYVAIDPSKPFVVRVGSLDRPAGPPDLKDMLMQLDITSKDRKKGSQPLRFSVIGGREDLFGKEAPPKSVKIPMEDYMRKVVVIMVGNEEEVATERDIHDVCSAVGARAIRGRSYYAIITHHAIRILEA